VRRIEVAESKVCIGCDVDLPVVAFGKRIVSKKGKLYPRPRCKPCTAKAQRWRTFELRLQGYPTLYKRCKCGGVIKRTNNICSEGGKL